MNSESIEVDKKTKKLANLVMHSSAIFAVLVNTYIFLVTPKITLFINYVEGALLASLLCTFIFYPLLHRIIQSKLFLSLVAHNICYIVAGFVSRKFFIS